MTFKKNNTKITATTCPVLSVNEFNRFKREETNKSFDEINKKPKSIEIPVQRTYDTLKDEIIEIACKDDVIGLKNVFSGVNQEYVKKYVEEKDILHKVIERGAYKITKFLIEEYNININSKNYEGFTPLHIAIIEGKFDLVELLVQKKANVNELEPDYYMNSLYLALKKEEYKIASYLMKNGAQVYEKDADDKWDYCTNNVMRKIFLIEEKSKELKHFMNLLNKLQKPY